MELCHNLEYNTQNENHIDNDENSLFDNFNFLYDIFRALQLVFVLLHPFHHVLPFYFFQLNLSTLLNPFSILITSSTYQHHF